MRALPFKRLVLYLGILLVGVYIAGGAYLMHPSEQANAAAMITYQEYLPVIFNAPSYNWLQFNGDPTHSGNNTLETAITIDNVSQLQLVFQIPLPAFVDGSPVYLSRVSTPGGIRNLIFLTTRDGRILALDAFNGATVWSKQYGPAGCLINNNTSRNEACYTTSSPAIDPNREFVYSYGLDGYVHKHAVGDGTEIVAGGWPELTTLKRYDEKGSSALSIVTAANGTGYLYVAQSGYPGDAGNYQGHITAINLADGSQKVFNSLCSDQAVHFVDSRVAQGPDCTNTQSAIWSRPGVIYDPYHDRILMSTGNGTFAPASFLWGDSVFSLNPDGSGSAGDPLDSYTPTNYQFLQDRDLDLGSTGPAILPLDQGLYPHLAVQGGKDGVVRLLNLDQLSGQNGVGHTGGEVFTIPIPMGGVILPQPAVWTDPVDQSTWVFVSNGNGIAGLELNISAGGDPSLVVRWTGPGGTSPLVANGVLFLARSGVITALNPVNGNVLWSDRHIGPLHWQSPIVDIGILYIADSNGKITAYSLP